MSRATSLERSSDEARRRTKIVATVGPACQDAPTLRAMIAAGMDVARLSLAHATLDDTLQRLQLIRSVAESEGAVVGVLADLPGPKVRTSPFPLDGVHLADGSVVELAPADGDDTSDERRIAVDLPAVLENLEPGDRVALGDGAIELVVHDVDGRRALAGVVASGWAQGRPGVILPAGRLAAASPTDVDLRLLRALAAAEVDAVAVSFVRSPSDITRARDALDEAGPMLVAKIETQEAVDSLEEVIAVADGVMVARGDLGIRCALEDVPHYQKRIIRTGVAYGRPVITATQMLESMVRAPEPTRAEVSDIANAVFDGTSALMLSAETAIGHDPVNAVRTMGRVAERAEREFDYLTWGRNLGRQQTVEAHRAPAPVRITAAISAAAWRAATDADVVAIIACTNSGDTARAISRFRPTMPVVAATPSMRTVRQLAMAWGVTPILTGHHGTTDDIVWFAVQATAAAGYVRSGELVAVLVGSPTDPEPATDTLRLVRVR
ncbi:MAG: pyruvate kinase [Actinomycetota bacterium]|nr:pyruvate kinase [Actinomycetota bacterium]